MKLDVYHHFPGDHSELASIKAQLDRIESMTTSSFDNLQASLDAEQTTLDDVAAKVNAAVAEIAALTAQIAGGVTADQAATLQGRLNAINAELSGVAAVIDPAVPPASA